MSEKKHCFIKRAFSNCICQKNKFWNFKSLILTNFLWSLRNTYAIHCSEKNHLSFFYSHSFIVWIFINELNLIFSFYIGNKNINHTNRIHSDALNNRSVVNPLLWWLVRSPKQALLQHKWSSMVVRHQNQLAKCPNDTQCSQTVFKGRWMSEQIGKNAQIAVSVH